MITIDAVGKDGANILGDLEGCSPAGGFFHTEWRTQYDLKPGDVVRGTDCYWAVTAGASLSAAEIDHYARKQTAAAG